MVASQDPGCAARPWASRFNRFAVGKCGLFYKILPAPFPGRLLIECLPQLPKQFAEPIQLEVRVEATRVGQHPDRGAVELARLPAGNCTWLQEGGPMGGNPEDG